ncbi:MAG: hypothetical protein ACPG1A_00725 [Halioglobus sp.]
MNRSLNFALGVLAILSLAMPGPLALAFNMPPANPYLADSNYAMAHADPAQQDALPQAGPQGPGRTLAPDEIQYTHTGPAFFGILTSGEYSDGRRVFWGNGLDRIVKLDYDTQEVVAEYFFPDVERYTEERADASIAGFDDSNDGIFALFRAFQEAQKLRSLANLYTVLDRDHNYYIGSKSGLITVYGDEDPDDAHSGIVKLREFQLPAEATGPIMGLSMTYDGWLIAATEHGYIAAIARDFSEYHLVRMRHAEGAEDKATKPTGYGWIRNAYAIDEDGGIYIASQDHMHKVVWTGAKLSTEEADGAWTAAYLNEWGHGTGATPSLMGFGDEDQFVVITDGQHQMNVVLFWRDAIPEDWEQLPDAPDRRIAGQAQVTMGNPELTEIQSEQSVVVAGHGALVVNNRPRNIPWYLPEQASTLLVSYLGSNPRHQPYGVQKFAWNPETRIFSEDWVNKEISSPSTVPIVGVGSNTAYLIGARNNQWTLEALDWDTGENHFHHVIGGQRYNVFFAGTLLDMNGRVHYGTPWGRVRLMTEQ